MAWNCGSIFFYLFIWLLISGRVTSLWMSNRCNIGIQEVEKGSALGSLKGSDNVVSSYIGLCYTHCLIKFATLNLHNILWKLQSSPHWKLEYPYSLLTCCDRDYNSKVWQSTILFHFVRRILDWEITKMLLWYFLRPMIEMKIQNGPYDKLFFPFHLLGQFNLVWVEETNYKRIKLKCVSYGRMIMSRLLTEIWSLFMKTFNIVFYCDCIISIL